MKTTMPRILRKQFTIVSAVCLGLAMALPAAAKAGEFVPTISISGYRSSSGTMTQAHRQAGNPLNYRGASRVESSYHGSNYFSYEIARKQHSKAMRDYQTLVKNFASDPESSIRQFNQQNPSARLQPVRQVRQVTQNTQARRVPLRRVSYSQRDENHSVVSSRPLAIVERPAQVKFARSAELPMEQRKPTLSLLSDTSKEQPPVKSESDKSSIWTHFRRALVGS